MNSGWRLLVEFEPLIYKIIEERVKDPMVQILIKKLYADQFEKKMIYRYDIVMFVLFILNISNKSIKDFTWEQLCELHHTQLVTQLKNEAILKESKLKNESLKIVKGIVENKLAYGFKFYKNLINHFYILMVKTNELNNVDNIIQINEYKHLLVNTVRVYLLQMNGNEKTRELHKTIYTNFPLDTKFEYMIQGSSGVYNLNIRTDHKIIKLVLEDFFQSFPKTGLYGENPDLKEHKIFSYYFIDSVGSTSIKSVKDFNEELFFKQLQFFECIGNTLVGEMPKVDRGKGVKQLLLHFYRYLTYKCRKELGEQLFSKPLEIAISSKSFFKLYKEKYTPMFYSKQEDIPKVDKFCILPSNDRERSTDASNKGWIYVDVTSVSEVYKEDLLNFLWYANGYITTKVRQVSYIKVCLNLKKEYYRNIKAINQKKEEFSEEFVIYIRSYFENMYSNKATLKSCLKSIRKYLDFHKEKYNISNTVMNILTLKGLEEGKGANPMTDRDLKTFYQGFKEMEKNQLNGELYTIVFELFIYSNLRIGEILNLERDCLDPSKTKDVIELKRLLKTSNGEYVYTRISKQIIALIKRAIELTNSFVDDGIYGKYIFIAPYKRRIRKENIRLDFYTYFNKVQNAKRGILEKKYSPYSLRHTFISNVYKEGISNGLTIPEIAKITGNSYKTANKHYRMFNEIDMYVEAMAKVTIAEVTVNGEILAKEKPVETKQIVKSGLGNCKENSCSYEDVGECLHCEHFVTYLNRIPAFEKLLSKNNEELNTAYDDLRIQEINVEKKLIAKYLADMYRMKAGIQE
ncbi:site-specific integrase [Priestia sp. Y58]|uniref:site-specific integrase n=1 Tax=Priestia sp. Y58 TaxID=2922804 RepID=UPI002404CF37|nr:site-specific integrase [Priestia sp. Y58]MDG0029961.1 site-specific integrase [Priestia sp. Y58]